MWNGWVYAWSYQTGEHEEQTGDMRRLTTRGGATAAAIGRREPFITHGALKGVDRDCGTGRLPEPWRTLYNDDWRSGALDYVVYSYATPIAWHTAEGWVVPDEKYSVTTSKHQGTLYEAYPRRSFTVSEVAS